MEEGKKLLADAQRTSPDNADVLMGLSYLALLEGNLDEVKRLLDKAVISDPTRADAWVLKGEAHRLQKQYPESLAAYQRALDLQSGNVLAQLGRASTLLDQGEWDKAIAAIDVVRKVLPNLPQANYLRAQALFEKKDFRGALESLQDVLKVMPKDMSTFLLLGQVHSALGNLIQAEDFLTRFVADQPQHLEARKLLADTELKLKSPEKAITVLIPALEQAPDDAQVLALLGSAMEEFNTTLTLGQQETISLLEQVWEKNPKNVNVGFLLTRHYLSLTENLFRKRQLGRSGTGCARQSPELRHCRVMLGMLSGTSCARPTGFRSDCRMGGAERSAAKPIVFARSG
jgi:tetratricopeptide (TPR) repeat protein